MEKLKRIANQLDTWSNVGLRIFLVCAVIIFVTAVVFAFLGDGVYESASTSVGIGNYSFELSKEHLPEPSAIRLRLVSGLIFASVFIALIAYALKIVRAILAPIKEGRPFSDTVAENIRKLSWVYIIAAVFYSVGLFAVQFLVFNCYDVSSLFLSDKIIGVEIEYNLDISFVAVFGVLQLVSYIFRYGAELQAESDETL